MAGISSTFPFKTTSLLTIPTKTTPLRFLLTSFESKLFGLRLYNSNFIKFSPFSLTHSLQSSIITARYGGGGNRSSGSSNSRRLQQQPELEGDQVIDDISTIRSDTVRLIDEKQNMIGIVSKIEAKQMADDAELNLVLVSPDADPPVLRIIDYSKYRYEQQKRKKDQQKKSTANRMDLKELKMGYNIDQHDYSVRMRAAKKFLKDGDKVKVIVNLKGRENDFRNIAIELLRRFQNDVGELATEESKNFRDRNIFIILVPNKAVLQKAQEPPKKSEQSELNEVSAGV